VECDVEEVGPSLKWASAKITRTDKSQQGGRQQAQSRNSGGDPWAHTPGTRYPDDDQPPF
jgi:single-strand DNA-binding protein